MKSWMGMRKVILRGAVVGAALFAGLNLAEANGGKQLTDAQVKKAIIKESIAEYPGNCPCPYSVARNGSSCGRRSAYSRPGGASPICYPKDVSTEMVKEWRENHKSE